MKNLLKEMLEIINTLFGKHIILKVLLGWLVFIIILIFIWIGMCLDGGQD